MGARHRFSLEYAPIAYEDLDEIFAYISSELQVPNAALNLLEAMEEAVEKLRMFPYKYQVARDALLASKGYRMLPIENFAVFYLVDDEQQIVSIRRVLYGKRNFGWLL